MKPRRRRSAIHIKQRKRRKRLQERRKLARRTRTSVVHSTSKPSS